jgi:PAS domain S-box-containing protein
LRIKDKTIGILAVDNKDDGEEAFKKININLLMTLGSQVAIAIENARLYQESQEQLGRLKVLNYELEEMKNYNEDILDNMSSGIIVTNNAGQIQSVNHQAEQIIGCKQKDIIGSEPRQIWSDQPKFVSAVSNLSHGRLKLREITFNADSDDEKTLTIHTTALKDVKGNIKGRLAVITDVTDLKKLELQVQRSDKLSALGRMAAGVAHEIKNPLTSMRLFVQMMTRRYTRDPEFWDKYSDILLTELDRLDKIVGDFVGFAKTPALSMEQVELQEILTKVMRLIKVQAQAQKVIFIVEVPEKLIVYGDKERLSQVFLNLILNALQAMPEKKRDGEIKIAAKKAKNKQVEVSIADNGCGIPKQNLEKLFLPFFTTKDRGTGLGLSIIHRLIEQHGGSIDVESTVDVGTTFTITLLQEEPTIIKPETVKQKTGMPISYVEKEDVCPEPSA